MNEIDYRIDVISITLVPALPGFYVASHEFGTDSSNLMTDLGDLNPCIFDEVIAWRVLTWKFEKDSKEDVKSSVTPVTYQESIERCAVIVKPNGFVDDGCGIYSSVRAYAAASNARMAEVTA